MNNRIQYLTFLGFVHWGEFPLSFAACLQQEECMRLLVASGANPNAQDTNGNTVLHMAVIHNRMEMFDIAFSLGASLSIRNTQGIVLLSVIFSMIS